jgi:mono/diheme cytochrome c family protein
MFLPKIAARHTENVFDAFFLEAFDEEIGCFQVGPLLVLPAWPARQQTGYRMQYVVGTCECAAVCFATAAPGWHFAMFFRLSMVALSLAACAERAPEEQPVPDRWYTATQVAAGAALYGQHCAVCHGADGSATAAWRTPDTNGHYPPPPLNGTAHAWHHPLSVLEATIADGGQPFGGVMPGFAALLPRDERLAIVAWIMSLWPDDIYMRWREIDVRNREP